MGREAAYPVHMPAWPPFTRDDLLHAAACGGFDMTFPVLVRRLIAETGCGATQLDMPAESGTAARGFDGVVEASGTTTWVPDGTSVWELSVQQSGAQGKADTDYGKRTAGPAGAPATKITFVEVMLTRWTKATTWSAQRTKERRWRRVGATTSTTS